MALCVLVGGTLLTLVKEQPNREPTFGGGPLVLRHIPK